METAFREQMKKRCDMMTELSVRLEKKLNGFPRGRIRVRNVRNKVYFYLADGEYTDGRDSGAERLLGSEDGDLINVLVQKSYLEKVLRACTCERDVLARALAAYPDVTAEEIYEHMNKERQKIAHPIVLPDDQYSDQWQKMPYKGKSIGEGVPFFETIKGERVRSKSEQIIAERLCAKGIPYRYECPLKIGRETLHPDFTILRMSDRKELYLEHCGKMDDPTYAEDMVKRMNKYANAGIIQGDRLFVTYETSAVPLDTRVIDRLIDEQFR